MIIIFGLKHDEDDEDADVASMKNDSNSGLMV